MSENFEKQANITMLQMTHKLIILINYKINNKAQNSRRYIVIVGFLLWSNTSNTLGVSAVKGRTSWLAGWLLAKWADRVSR